MKANPFYTILLLAILAISCNQSGVDIKITNATNNNIDSLSVRASTGRDKQYVSLLPNESLKYVADMEDLPTIDGNYIISYKMNGAKKITGFGYFTNGYPLDKEISLRIEKDTVIMYDLENHFQDKSSEGRCSDPGRCQSRRDGQAV